MMKCSCGSEWFLEEKLVRPAGRPVEIQHYPLPYRDVARLRYRCAECGVIYGQDPQPQVKQIVAETDNPQPKRRGRPPKAAQS